MSLLTIVVIIGFVVVWAELHTMAMNLQAQLKRNEEHFDAFELRLAHSLGNLQVWLEENPSIAPSR